MQINLARVIVIIFLSFTVTDNELYECDRDGEETQRKREETKGNSANLVTRRERERGRKREREKGERENIFCKIEKEK